MSFYPLCLNDGFTWQIVDGSQVFPSVHWNSHGVFAWPYGGGGAPDTKWIRKPHGLCFFSHCPPNYFLCCLVIFNTNSSHLGRWILNQSIASIRLAYELDCRTVSSLLTERTGPSPGGWCHTWEDDPRQYKNLGWKSVSKQISSIASVSIPTSWFLVESLHGLRFIIDCKL